MGRPTTQPKLKQTRIDTYSSTSTGHQVGSGISKPASWHRHRDSKLQEQFCRAPLTNVLSRPSPKPTGGVFAGCTVYVNGSTAPSISDVELKRLLCVHGARVTTAMSRRGTSHVVLARGVDGSGVGVGGGLAAGKLQREVSGRRVGGVRYVCVEWVLDSISAGRRLAESKYPVVSFGGGSRDLAGMFAKKA